jgi:hypothetical protein
MSSGRWKFLSILLLVVVAVASVGSYVVWNRSVAPNTFSLSSLAVEMPLEPGFKMKVS